jgi:hypothetical protein
MSAADKLATHFDGDWTRTKSTLRDRSHQSSYNPLFSWDGQADDPHSFAKLEVTHFPATLTKPMCTSGSAVIQLVRNHSISA